jgi:predicted methyltransferase MtxX (methanogen marker protein 4)
MNNFKQVCPSGNTMIDGDYGRESRGQLVITSKEKLREYAEEKGLNWAEYRVLLRDLTDNGDIVIDL